MRKLMVFNHVTADGFFADAKSDMSWAHQAAEDPEWNAFVEGNAAGGGVLLFGRITYQMMAGYWPSPHALEKFPTVARRMNETPKIVFSRTLDKASWSNTTLKNGDFLAEDVRRMKQEPGHDITILGSGSIVSQLTQQGLIDVFHLIVNPIILGQGISMFAGLSRRQNLRLAHTRAFHNGNILLSFDAVD